MRQRWDPENLWLTESGFMPDHFSIFKEESHGRRQPMPVFDLHIHIHVHMHTCMHAFTPSRGRRKTACCFLLYPYWKVLNKYTLNDSNRFFFKLQREKNVLQFVRIAAPDVHFILGWSQNTGQLCT